MTDNVAAPQEAAWRPLLAAISAIAVFGLSIGLSAPLLSLLLDARGTDPVVTGLNAGAAFVGVLLGPLAATWALRRLDVRRFLLALLLLDIVFFLALHVFRGLGAWFALRIVLGLIGAGMFTASEAWINRLTPDASRGRIMGAYVAALSAGFGIGPLLLGITGIHGWAPFLANTAIALAAMLPVLAAGADGTRLSWENAPNPLGMFRRAPVLLFMVAIFGLYESSMMAVLPLWGVRVGLGPAAAAGTISAIYFGGVALQVPIGWFSDHAGRRAALFLCGAAGAAGAALLPPAAGSLAGLVALLAVWGGLAGGIGPVTLTMGGDLFRGADLLSMNAALVIAYGLGALVGPFAGGAALDAWSPDGLPAFMAFVFVVLLAIAALSPARAIPGRAIPTAPR